MSTIRVTPVPEQLVGMASPAHPVTGEQAVDIALGSSTVTVAGGVYANSIDYAPQVQSVATKPQREPLVNLVVYMRNQTILKVKASDIGYRQRSDRDYIVTLERYGVDVAWFRDEEVDFIVSDDSEIIPGPQVPDRRIRASSMEGQ